MKLAKKAAVKTELRVPETSLVVSHSVDEGSLVAEGQEIVSLAASDSFAFRVEISQVDLPRVKEGQRVVVRLSSQPDPIEGTVHSVLPGPASPGLTFAVRVDLKLAEIPALGLFGTAEVVVGTADGVIAVPEAAVLRDDITAKDRIAVVTADEKTQWLEVTTGARSAGWVEVLGRQLVPGARVITQGQVGLPDGAPVRVSP
jgi:multidrug efflux pump subunit AcrA (membrane-fusion protein)